MFYDVVQLRTDLVVTPSGRVTPDLLFKGAFPGETLGPYLSQFFVQPTVFGSQPIGQQQLTYLPGIDYGTDFAKWLDIQNGVDTGLQNQVDSQLRYRRNGRDLAAFTHVDVLYQAYFTAFLTRRHRCALESRQSL